MPINLNLDVLFASSLEANTILDFETHTIQIGSPSIFLELIQSIELDVAHIFQVLPLFRLVLSCFSLRIGLNELMNL
jgi:hypothetical protein